MTIDTAEFREFYRKERLCISRPLGEPSPDFIAHINAHVARQVQAARDQALEEAAKICTKFASEQMDPDRLDAAKECADAIRTLRSPQEAASTAQEKKQ